MFRRKESKLPPDPVYPADLKGLGYYVTAKDHIKAIEDPRQDFNYFINKNERYNDVHREAMHICIRNMVIERLQDLGLSIIRLPAGAGPTDPHIPILASKDLASKSRVIVVFNESWQDLAIWAYRDLGNSDRGGINVGSAVNFVKKVQSLPSPPGIVIANPGQLLWWRKGKRAVSFQSWDSLPRQSGVHPGYRIEAKNRVPGNESWEAHARSIFLEVLDKRARQDARIYTIGLTDGGNECTAFLDANWDKWSSRIAGMAFGVPLFTKTNFENPRFVEFLETRGRSYLLSSEPAGTPISETDEREVCPAFASGEHEFSESIMNKAYGMMIEHFDTLE